MELPKYLIDALYKYSEDSIKEQAHFMELQKQAEEADLADAIKAKHKESWLEHLFSPAKAAK
jgi:hypothetical protein